MLSLNNSCRGNISKVRRWGWGLITKIKRLKREKLIKTQLKEKLKLATKESKEGVIWFWCCQIKETKSLIWVKERLNGYK